MRIINRRTFFLMGFYFGLEIREDERTRIFTNVDTKMDARSVANLLGVGQTLKMRDKTWDCSCLISNGSEAADGLRILGFPIPLDAKTQNDINIGEVGKMLGLNDNDISNFNSIL